MVFAMQGAGLVVGPLIASILLAANVPQNLIWRILLGLGAIPGLAVFYLRRQINETPRFAQAGGDLEELQASIAAATGQAASSGPRPSRRPATASRLSRDSRPSPGTGACSSG